jgi:uncharacterized protein YpmB
MSGVTGRIRSAATPECANLSKGVKFSSLIAIVVVLIAFVLLGSALIYNYTKKIPEGTEAAAADKKKKQIIGGLTIASVVALGVSLVVDIWQYVIVSKAVNQCLVVA